MSLSLQGRFGLSFKVQSLKIWPTQSSLPFNSLHICLILLEEVTHKSHPHSREGITRKHEQWEVVIIGGHPRVFPTLDQCFSNFNIHIDHLEILLSAGSDSVRLVWGVRVCISSKLPGDLTLLAGIGTTKTP